MADERPAGPDGKPVDRRHSWFARAFEDADGIPDEARMMAVAFCIWFMAMVTLVVVLWTHSFSPDAVGKGVGFMAAGIGGWFWMRGKQ